MARAYRTELEPDVRYFASVVAQKAAGSAIEWCGGHGFVRDTGIEKYWRDSKVRVLCFASLR